MAFNFSSHIPNLFRFFRWLGKVHLRPLGVYCFQDQHWLFLAEDSEDKTIYRLPFSSNHFDFKKRQKVEWTLSSGVEINPKLLSSVRFFSKQEKHYVSFLYQKGSKNYLGLASSIGLSRFKTESLRPTKAKNTALLPHKEGYLALSGRKNIALSFSEDLSHWKSLDKKLLQARPNHFDSGPLRLLSALERKDGILLLYDCEDGQGRQKTLSIGAAILSKSNPTHILWRCEEPLWQEDGMKSELSPLGLCADRNQVRNYYLSDSGKILSTQFLSPFSRLRQEKKESPRLQRPQHNPIIAPREEYGWDSVATFNPAAIELDGKVHLLYRAQGPDGVSVVGYAISNDGLHFHRRLPHPIYTPREDFEGARRDSGQLPTPFFASGGVGGGWGGCEDARATRIDGKVYLVYAAFNGWEQTRLAISSIEESDFLQENWSQWKPPQLMSKRPTIFGTGNKNGAILPEKIKNKYVIFHRLWPNICIDYLDDLDFSDENKWLETKDIIPPRKGMWDGIKVGVGAPPLKTDQGWLLIYQAVGSAGQYKIGAMLLDKDNPAKVLFRSRSAILEPEHWYENHGHKAGVAYPCGAVIKDKKLFVYYGGADTVTCVASANLDQFLYELMHDKVPSLPLQPVKIR